MKSATEAIIPTEIARDYTIAMLKAQRWEISLKSILKIAEYQAWGAEIATEKQLKNKTPEQFIDEAMLGTLVTSLKRSGIIKNAEKVFKIFENARVCRNNLAHSFLADQDFDNLTKALKSEIWLRLLESNVYLHRALAISEKIRSDLEKLAARRMEDFV